MTLFVSADGAAISRLCPHHSRRPVHRQHGHHLQNPHQVYPGASRQGRQLMLTWLVVSLFSQLTFDLWWPDLHQDTRILGNNHQSVTLNSAILLTLCSLRRLPASIFDFLEDNCQTLFLLQTGVTRFPLTVDGYSLPICIMCACRVLSLPLLTCLRSCF